MKYAAGWMKTFGAPIERLCRVTEKAVGFTVDNGKYGRAGREWIEFFPKSQIKIGELENDSIRVMIPYWLFKAKGIYMNQIVDVRWDDSLVEVAK